MSTYYAIYTKKGISIGMLGNLKLPRIMVSKKAAEYAAKEFTKAYRKPYFVKKVTVK